MSENIDAPDENPASKIVVRIVFNQSLGNLRAYQARAGAQIATGELKAVGRGDITLAEVQRGDVIGVDGETEGKAATLSILNAETSPATPIPFNGGDILQFDVL